MRLVAPISFLYRRTPADIKGDNTMQKERGFTLIELLVVIAIIAILAAILFPVFSAAKEKAREITSLSNVKQIGLGIYQYLEDSDEVYPESDQIQSNGTPDRTWRDIISPYVKSVEVYADPSNTENGVTNGWQGDNFPVSYGANANGNWYYQHEVAPGDGDLYGNQQNYTSAGSDAWGWAAGITPMVSWASWNGSSFPGCTQLSQLSAPSSLILVGETTLPWQSGEDGWGVPAACTMAYPGIPTSSAQCWAAPGVYSGHNGLATYVFCDGHAKALSLAQTVTPLNMWDNIDIGNNVAAPQQAQTYAAVSEAYWQLQ
jgi:prepilin-type N-terminal cleavage/methylation domain-containing protein/prepilin-type processing-associated H-X9-DG protein